MSRNRKIKTALLFSCETYQPTDVTKEYYLPIETLHLSNVGDVIYEDFGDVIYFAGIVNKTALLYTKPLPQ